MGIQCRGHTHGAWSGIGGPFHPQRVDSPKDTVEGASRYPPMEAQEGQGMDSREAADRSWQGTASAWHVECEWLAERRGMART